MISSARNKKPRFMGPKKTNQLLTTNYTVTEVGEAISPYRCTEKTTQCFLELYKTLKHKTAVQQTFVLYCINCGLHG
jgi:hypothetical protein